MPNDNEQKPSRTERANQNRAANTGGAQESRAASIARARAKRVAKSTSISPTSTAGDVVGRNRAVERRQEREQERRRQQITVAIITAAAIIGLIVLAVLVVNAPAEAPIPETAARYEGLSQSRTDDGYPRLGDPRALVQVGLYSSFDCTACQSFHENAMDDLVERVRAGDISITFIPLSGTGSITNGRGAAIAAVCAAQQNDFWRFSDALFSWTPIYGNQSFTNNRIQTGISELGMDTGAFNSCVTSGGANETLTSAQTQSRNLSNFSGTPTVTINGIVPLNDENLPLTDPIDILNAIDTRIAEIESRGQPESTAEATADVGAESTAEATGEPVADATAEATESAPVESTPEAEPTAEATP